MWRPDWYNSEQVQIAVLCSLEDKIEKTHVDHFFLGIVDYVLYNII